MKRRSDKIRSQNPDKCVRVSALALHAPRIRPVRGLKAREQRRNYGHTSYPEIQTNKA